MLTVTVHEAATQLSTLLDRIESGESATIVRAGEPVADLVPHRRRTVKWGTLKGRIRYDDADLMGPAPDAVTQFATE